MLEVPSRLPGHGRESRRDVHDEGPLRELQVRENGLGDTQRSQHMNVEHGRDLIC